MGGTFRSGGDFAEKATPLRIARGGLFPPEHSPPEWGGLSDVWGGVRGDSYFLKNNLLLPRMGGTPGGFGGD